MSKLAGAFVSQLSSAAGQHRPGYLIARPSLEFAKSKAMSHFVHPFIIESATECYGCAGKIRMKCSMPLNQRGGHLHSYHCDCKPCRPRLAPACRVPCNSATILLRKFDKCCRWYKLGRFAKGYNVAGGGLKGVMAGFVAAATAAE